LQPRDALALESTMKLFYDSSNERMAQRFVLEEVNAGGPHPPSPRHSATP